MLYQLFQHLFLNLKGATLSLDDCDTSLTVKYGPKLGYSCANVSTQVLEKRYNFYLFFIFAF